ncbi:MAG: MBL fold metallo-hydrolase [ANME-2 cluster archaeon]|nr:MBL fold metallo-hydrolase [ANME-2 cluster archaeon]
MNLRFLGGAGEVGRSAVVVDDNILLDYGMKPSDPPQYPIGGVQPDSIIVSHGHLDHCGVVPNLMDMKPGVFMTPVTKDLTALLAKDTMKIANAEGHVLPFIIEDIRDFELHTSTVDYGTPFDASGYEATLYDAGHIPGSSSIYLENKTGSLLYTGDVDNRDTNLLAPAEKLPVADIAIVESTYYGIEHSPRPKLEAAFADSIKATVDNGGWAIIPAFAIGRTQEVLMILEKYGIRSWVDGMGKDVYKIFKKHPDYLKDPARLDKAFKFANPVDSRVRRNVLDEPGVIVTTAGMLNGGPALYYLKQLHSDPRSKVMLTGYQVEGTNGRMALERGHYEDKGKIIPLIAKLELYDFSAHSSDSGLKEMVQDQVDRGCQVIICMHGDRTSEFAAWINENMEVKAIAPDNGDQIYM